MLLQEGGNTMLAETQTNGALALEQKDRVIIIPAQDEITARKLGGGA